MKACIMTPEQATVLPNGMLRFDAAKFAGMRQPLFIDCHPVNYDRPLVVVGFQPEGSDSLPPNWYTHYLPPEYDQETDKGWVMQTQKIRIHGSVTDSHWFALYAKPLPEYITILMMPDDCPIELELV